ncbi:MAG: hypothetical protein K2W93_16270 [Burkholderiaceae bacterium]|nr:hypothetical protein [Burkholderiaceae bacterium]
MSSPQNLGAGWSQWRLRLAARLQRQAQPLFLTAEGLRPLLDGANSPQRTVQEWAEAHRGTAARLIVSARLLHELVCEPGLPLAQEADLQAYGRQQFSHYFGAAAKQWPLASWRLGTLPTHGAEQGSEQCGLSALHGLDWPALRLTFEANAVQLRQVQPAWAPVLSHVLASEPVWAAAPQAGLAWVEGQVLTWLQLRAGRVQALRQLRLPEASVAALYETLAELRSGFAGPVLALGFGLSAEPSQTDAGASEGVRLLGRLTGTAPQAEWFAPPRQASNFAPAPDFLGPRQVYSRLAWGLAATAAVVLATAAVGLQQSQQARADAQAQQRRLATEYSRLRGTNVAPVTKPLARGAEQAQPLRAAAEVQKLLQLDWEPLLANVEQAGLSGGATANASAPAALSWLALDINATRNDLRLEGLAADKLLPLQVADRLNAAPGWREVMLSRFQTAEQGMSGQRFELSAKLQPASLQRELPALPTPASVAEGKTP